MSVIIGREKEVAELKELYDSDKSEFVAVYGRRRVGKTFLVDEALKASTQSAWSLRGDDETEGGQIDLLINRKDNVVDMCEMKFYNENFTVSKAYHAKLVHRQNLLATQLPKRSVVHHVLITTFGLNYNEYSGIFQHVITIDQLF